MSHRAEPELEEQVSRVREFNRFYTARLGLLRRRHFDGDFSLTEARILYEIGAKPKMNASILCSILGLNAGYISRLLSALTKRKLVHQTTSESDGREKHLTLTATGERAVARLNEQSTMQIREMLGGVSAREREELVAALTRVQSILADESRAVRIVRLKTADDDVRAILQEYYEAVHVVQRDEPGSLEKIVGAAASGMWVAYLGDEVVGCVVLRRLERIARAAECKRLYVRPSSLGNRVADKLMDALEEFAHSQGIDWIYLDSYDDLKAAIGLYARRGYARCGRYNDNPQATLFMRKRISE